MLCYATSPFYHICAFYPFFVHVARKTEQLG